MIPTANVSTIFESISSAKFFNLTQTSDEISVVVPATVNLLEYSAVEFNFRCFKVHGPLDFSLIGILSFISTCLADQKVSIFAVSTYDTDYVMVNEEKVDLAVDTFKKKGIKVIEDAHF
ncbi:hypothetical protein HK099_000157 [Clydaea vesicula]|uniref:CASTOR ACT domain-containing protein n=1 Tax=Clydaea vesicula TaxID=447962 RepID=A0AAD5Y2A7_9FUNG|nr:hypothetical protein HK099_000157 [Clydaea vesicula]